MHKKKKSYTHKLKLKKLTFILTFLILHNFLTTCSKYENGPLISFRSKITRIAKTWCYESKLDLDLGITIVDNLPEIEITFNKDGSYYESNGITGNWRFKGEVDLEIQKNLNTDSFKIEIYEITRLSNKQLWLKDKNIVWQLKAK